MTAVHEEAARWFARLGNTAADHPDRGAFESWLTAHPAHAAEYAAFARLWEDFDSTRRLNALAQAVEQRDRQRALASRARRALLKRGALALLLCAGLGVVAWERLAALRARPLLHAALSTQTGQIARQALPDGSRLVIDARSSLDVTYYRDRREARLKAGQVIFEVAPDAARPFTVHAGSTRVVVVGTRFAVESLAGPEVRVSVERGRVAVYGGAGSAVAASAGDVVEIGTTGVARPVKKQAADELSWERGVLVFDGATLADIAARLSRYRSEPVLAAEVPEPRITAVVQIRDIEDFLHNLPATAPVRLEREAQGLRLSPR